ncbi:MAG: acyltransferase [Mycobacterium sp.]|nr:acyltransferase [Mycobacterium sp.]
MGTVASPGRRELAVDAYRVCAAIAVVVGHWLAAAVVFRDGHIVRSNILVEAPWTQWLTWIFQVVPVFFLVAGYASAVSWTGRGATSARDWLGRRVRTVLGPTTAYVVAMLAAVAVSVLAGVDNSTLDLGAWAVAMHLWFIPVYVVLVVLTPAAVAAHRRWGLFAPMVLAAGVIAVDTIGLGAGIPEILVANNLLCWAAIFQLGVAWAAGSVDRRNSAVLLVLAVATLVIALVVGPYPISLIGVPGQVVQNSSPPSVVMLAFATAQSAALIMVAPAVTARLQGARVRSWLRAANRRVMVLYLWHMVAVVPFVMIVYPAGWFPQPAVNSAQWWWTRLLWIAALSVLTAVVLAIVAWAKSLMVTDLPTVPVSLPVNASTVILILGTAFAVTALRNFSASGFAPDGRFPVSTALCYLFGVAIVALRPVQRTPAGLRDQSRADDG